MNAPTIFAPATGTGPAGLAVIRISGSAAATAVAALSGRAPPAPRRAVLRALADPANGEPLDRCLLLWMPGPGSYTGEDVAELQLHGGRAVMGGVLAALSGIDGLRLAEPGEFTRRAFDNGKLDLTQAEGLADLVAAETAAQRRQALQQMDGALGRLYEDWRARLLKAQAHFEAMIDFSDQDLPAGLAAGVRADVAALDGEIAAHLAHSRHGERLRDGVRVAIVGAPNAGKSSLLNRLARREAAIVAQTAGTTRDVIDVHMDLGGFPATLTDTAGIREATDAVERQGVARALQRAEQADIRLIVVDGADTEREDIPESLVNGTHMIAFNKMDLLDGDNLPMDREGFVISALTGAGIEGLLRALEEKVAALCHGGADAIATRQRHRTALAECRDALARFGQAGASELAAEDLRLAARALGRITGRVDVEDLLDLIFRDFCIGK